jgi:hypothetical protein
MKLRAGLSLLLATIILLSGLSAARAQDPLCEPELWTQMTQRATLLGQMDTSTVENLVYKPDSVLEYTCFNRFMGVSAANVTYYMRPYYVTEIIQPSVTDYLYRNFGHTYMGGRLVAGGAGAAPPAGTYVCDAMTYVWEMAKCFNFSQTEPQDSIYGLDEFAAALDIRTFPAPGTCTSPDPSDYGAIPVFGVNLALDLPVLPTDCGDPFTTGLIINQPVGPNDTRPQEYAEKICPNPACNYVPTGMDTGTCEP